MEENEKIKDIKRKIKIIYELDKNGNLHIGA